MIASNIHPVCIMLLVPGVAESRLNLGSNGITECSIVVGSMTLVLLVGAHNVNDTRCWCEAMFWNVISSSSMVTVAVCLDKVEQTSDSSRGQVRKTVLRIQIHDMSDLLLVHLISRCCRL